MSITRSLQRRLTSLKVYKEELLTKKLEIEQVRKQLEEKEKSESNDEDGPRS